MRVRVRVTVSGWVRLRVRLRGSLELGIGLWWLPVWYFLARQWPREEILIDIELRVGVGPS